MRRLHRLLMARSTTWCLIAACSVAMIGCSEASKWDRVAVKGTASVDGKPFNGSLSLRPTAGIKGPSVSAKVVDGEFRFTRSTGPVQGRHFAMLMPKSEFGSRPESQLSLATEVPSEPPFELSLKFETISTNDGDRKPANAAPQKDESAK